MGVQRWLVASALCVAVRGESVPLWHCPRWGHPRAGSWGHPGRSCPPPHAALLGTQGRQAGEVVSCLLGPQICSFSKTKESWGWGGGQKGGNGTCLEGLAGLGGVKIRLNQARWALTCAQAQAVSLALLPAKSRQGSQAGCHQKQQEGTRVAGGTMPLRDPPFWVAVKPSTVMGLP